LSTGQGPVGRDDAGTAQCVALDSAQSAPSIRLFLTWGGLRGGLSLALVLVLPANFPLKSEFLAIATAVVLSSLLLNAATTRSLMRFLKLDQLSQAERILYRRSLRQVVERVFAELRDAADRGSLSADLVAELQTRSLQALDVTGESMPAEQALLFDFHQLLLQEQQYYDARLGQGILVAHCIRNIIALRSPSASS